MSTNPRVFSSWIWWEKKNQVYQKDVYCIHDLLDHNRNMIELYRIHRFVGGVIDLGTCQFIFPQKRASTHSLWIFLAVSHQLTHALTDYNKNSQPCSCGFSPKCPATVRSLLQWARNFQSTILLQQSMGPRAKGQERLQRLNFGWQKWCKTAFGKVGS